MNSRYSGAKSDYNLTDPCLKPEAGFTIIETLIVLGIAGMIFLLIFLAVPSLARNGRNSQRKQDVVAILGAFSRYELSNSGSFPPDYAALTNPTTGGGSIKLTHYDPTAIIINVESAGQHPQLTMSTIVPTPTADRVDIYNYHLCDDTIDGATASGAGYRDIVALYAIETAGSLFLQCQQL